MSPETSLIARQPICNKDLKVIGYELLYRMGNNEAIIDNPDSATTDVLLTAFADMSITDIVGPHAAFVNFTGNLLLGELPPISPKQLVIELLEDQEVTDALLKRLKRYRKQGYRIALDDFCLTKETIPLIDYADIIKLDVLADPPETWEKYIPFLKTKGITLLAEKVETHEVFEQCKTLGFDYFQGYFFAKPNMVSGKKVSRSELTVINLLNALNSNDANVGQINELISQDAGVSYSLLRMINSGLYNLPNQVDSIRQAITLLGLNQMRQWVSFLALSNLDNKPKFLSDTAFVRARMCEWLGEHIDQAGTSQEYFTAGLLSIIDAFFDMPMDQLLDKLSLKTSVKDAILKREGKIGAAIECVVQYEQGNWSYLMTTMADEYNVDTESFMQAYIDSLGWLEEQPH